MPWLSAGASAHQARVSPWTDSLPQRMLDSSVSLAPGVATMHVADWLRSLGLEQYEAAFRENEIDDKMLPRLTAEDLKELGVTVVGHRPQATRRHHRPAGRACCDRR